VAGEKDLKCKEIEIRNRLAAIQCTTKNSGAEDGLYVKRESLVSFAREQQLEPKTNKKKNKVYAEPSEGETLLRQTKKEGQEKKAA